MAKPMVRGLEPSAGRLVTSPKPVIDRDIVAGFAGRDPGMPLGAASEAVPEISVKPVHAVLAGCLGASRVSAAQ